MSLSLFRSFRFFVVLGSAQGLAFATNPTYPARCTPNQSTCVWFAPTDMPIHAVANELKLAKKSIRIATFNADVPLFAEILKQKLAAGLTVEFLVDYRLAAESNRVWNSLSPHPKLTRYRVPVLRGRMPQMHNKIILIDDSIVLAGSANWTYSGLVANFENVTKISDTSAVDAFKKEFQELKSQSHLACEIFAKNPAQCGAGQEQWDNSFSAAALNGKYPDDMFLENAPPDCKNYSYGLVDRLDSRTRNLDPDTCFKDKRWSRLIRQWNALTQPSSFSSKDSPSTKSPVEVYFSPEDSVERKMIAELDRTLQNPSQSFVYLSANFVTNGALVDKLIELNQQGVHLRLFFDHGRFTDPQFQSQIEKLKTLGFTSGGQNPNEKVTVFHNTLTGSYGCNHNKFAIIGSPNGAVVMNGSANWSKSAMMSNDENIVIFRDPHVATLFAHEFLSQEFVYRYQQNLQAPGFQQDLEKIARLVPCIKESLQGTSCTLATGAQWNFNQTTTAHLISLRQVPANPDSERVWAHVVDARGHTTDIELFTHRVFDGAWVTSVPLPLGVAATMKFFKTPHNTDQNNPVGQAIWEFDGLDRNRSLLPFSLGTAIIRNSYLWGRP